MDDLKANENVRNELDGLRREIDRIDEGLLHLFAQRMEKVREVAAFKLANNVQILDSSREKEVLEKIGKLNNPGLQPQAEAFFKSLMAISKELQAELIEKQRQPGIPVGFQGIPGSYSEQALREYFAEYALNKVGQAINYRSFEEVFLALQTGEIDYGVLPLENSFTGGIAEVYDLLCRYGFYIAGEKCVHVDHNLLAPPGTKLEDIREVYSHPQALLQCSKYLKSHPQWNQAACSNTAVSAKFIADWAGADKAAIAGTRAAELYNLAVLAQGINNSKENYTRFIIIGRKPESTEESNKISLAVAIAHEAGSLYRTLSHFAKNGLNMLRIESRPIIDKTWEYLFYIDFEGNLERQEVRKAVEAIQKDSTFFRLLGNYRSDQRR